MKLKLLFGFVLGTLLALVMPGYAITTNVIEWQTNWPVGGKEVLTNAPNLPGSSSWFTGTAASLNGVANGNVTNLVATDISSSSLTWLTYFAPSNNPVSLQPGQTIQITVGFSNYLVSGQTSGRNLRFGIFSCTNQMTLDNGNPKQTNYVGYGQFMNYCNPFGNQPFTTHASTNLDPNVNSGAVFASSADFDQIGTTGGGNTNFPGPLDNNNYNLIFSVTENNPTNISITTMFNGPNLTNNSISQTVTDTNYCFTNFNSFVMRLGSGTGSAEYWYISSFQVVVITPATIPVITYTVSGSTLTLSWPSANLGWTLQSQTNSINIGLSSNWESVGGSTAVDQMSFPMDQTKGTVFFRLKAP